MRYPFRAAVGLAAALFALGPAAAEEILYFTSGKSLPIRAHKVEDGVIYVDLGGNDLIAFSESLVERIEVAGVDVLLPQSRANRMFGRPDGASYPVTVPATNRDTTFAQPLPPQTDPRQRMSLKDHRSEVIAAGRLRPIADVQNVEGERKPDTKAKAYEPLPLIGVAEERNAAPRRGLLKAKLAPTPVVQTNEGESD
jgi:hypothetical protein